MWNDFFKDYEYKKTVQACEIQGNMSHVYELLEENSYFLERHISKTGSIKTTFYMLDGNNCSVSGRVGDFLVIENLNKEDFKAYICPKEEFLQRYILKTEEGCDKGISDLAKHDKVEKDADKESKWREEFRFIKEKEVKRPVSDSALDGFFFKDLEIYIQGCKARDIELISSEKLIKETLRILGEKEKYINELKIALKASKSNT